MKFGEWLKRAGGPSLEDLEDWAKTAQTGSETNRLKGNEMSTLERLKEMEAKAEASDERFDNLDERMDTSESFEFLYALQEAWPKLLAVVEAAQEAEDEHLVYSKKLADALKALHEEPK